MPTRIFFNPADSIANINDYNEAVRQGQIYHEKHQQSELVIAKNEANEEYAIFYSHDQATPQADHAQPYHEHHRIK